MREQYFVLSGHLAITKVMMSARLFDRLSVLGKELCIDTYLIYYG